MTIQSNTSRITYTGDNVSTAFPVPFLFFANADITVVKAAVGGGVATLALNVDYTLTGAGVAAGGTLTKTTALLTGETLGIFLDPPRTQLSHYLTNDIFPAATLETNLDREVQISQRLYDLITRAIRAPDSDNNPQLTLPSAISRALKYPTFDASGNLSMAVSIPSGTLSQASIGSFLYPQTAAEAAASVTPTNLFYPPLTVDRYGTNTTPGTTSMTAAWQAAINVAKKNGGTVTFGPGPYLIDAALDLTFPVGSQNCSFAIIGQGRFKAPTNTVGQPATPSIILKHTVPGHAFDTTGSLGVHFENLSIGTDNTNYPLTCFLLARNTDGSSRSDRIINCYVLGKFSKTILYNYGAEDGTYFGNQFYNISADLDTSVFDISGFNIRALTSTFTTIAVGSKSCIDHKVIGGEYANLFQGLGTTADVWRFDGARLISIRDVWCDSAAKAGTSGGRALVNIDGTNAASSVIFLSGVRGESAPFAANYGIFVSNNARTHGPLLVEGCLFPNSTAMLGGGTGASISSLLWIGSSNSSQGGAINFGGALLSPQIDGSAGAVVAASIDFFAGTWNVDQLIQKNGQVRLNLRDFSQASGSQWFVVRNGSGVLVVSACDDSGNVVSNNIQFLHNGTTQMAGKLFPVQDTGAAQAVTGLYGGTGVPSNANGANGDFYFRGDTPGVALQMIYQKVAGAWVGKV